LKTIHKLLLNFNWWVNLKDPEGMNIFQGGFLGLDNIGAFDRSQALPTGGHLEQSDGTSWMGMFCLNMLTIALELAVRNRVYEDIATKFFEHFLSIAAAMNNIGGKGIGLWDEQDEFFYDVLHLPSGENRPLKLRSMVGLIPLYAVTTIEPELLDKLPEFKSWLEWFLEHRPQLAKLVSRWQEPGLGERRLLAICRGHRMKRVLRRMLDEREFLSPYGVRALTRARRAPVSSRCRWRALYCGLPAGRVEQRAVRRQLELARPDLVSSQLPADRVAAAVPPLLRRRVQGRVPERLGPVSDAE
jgi:hypothetical protein